MLSEPRRFWAWLEILPGEVPREVPGAVHPPWSQLVQLAVWSRGATPGWKALVTLGQ